MTTYGQIAPQDTNPGSGGPRIATPLAGLSVGDSDGRELMITEHTLAVWREPAAPRPA